jgi:hypothetical protein
VTAGADWSDITSLAAHCARRHWSRLIPADARAEAALDGIVDALTSGEDPYYAGLAAISRAVDRHKAEHGLGTSGRAHATAYYRWWSGWVAYADRQHDYDDVDDRLTLAAVWSRLPEQHREALALLAEHGTIAAAADAAGQTYARYNTRLYLARRAARELWHAPDTAPRHYAHAGRRGANYQPGRALSALVHRRARTRRRDT